MCFYLHTKISINEAYLCKCQCTYMTQGFDSESWTCINCIMYPCDFPVIPPWLLQGRTCPKHSWGLPMTWILWAPFIAETCYQTRNDGTGIEPWIHLWLSPPCLLLNQPWSINNKPFEHQGLGTMHSCSKRANKIHIVNYYWPRLAIIDLYCWLYPHCILIIVGCWWL